VSKTKKDMEKFRFKDFGKKPKQKYLRDKDKKDWRKILDEELQIVNEEESR
jgi:hypothetical protein